MFSWICMEMTHGVGVAVEESGGAFYEARVVLCCDLRKAG